MPFFYIAEHVGAGVPLSTHLINDQLCVSHRAKLCDAVNVRLGACNNTLFYV